MPLRGLSRALPALHVARSRREESFLSLFHNGSVNNPLALLRLTSTTNCPIPDLLNKSLRKRYRLKKSIIEKKRNYFKASSISTNRFKSAFHTVLEILALTYPLLTNSANEAPDCFMRYTIFICNFRRDSLSSRTRRSTGRPF